MQLATTEVTAALADAGDVGEACEALVDVLVAHGFALPSVYLLRGERLRCHASRGYWQVIDGFAAGIGVIGTVLASGQAAVIHDASRNDDFLEAVPNVRGQAAVPVWFDEQVVGVLSVETRTELPCGVAETLSACASALGRTIDLLGGLPVRSSHEVLADAVLELANLFEVTEVQQHVVAVAQVLSAMDTVLIARRHDHGRFGVTARSGPLADKLERMASDDLAFVADWVAHGTSSYFTAGGDTSAHQVFRRAGADYVLVLPLLSRGAISGIMIIVDHRGQRCSPEQITLLEQLAAHGAATLQSFETVDDLRTLAFTDALTGIGNATAFAAFLDDWHGSTPSAVCLIDIDHFKAINDTAGHEAGDRVLRAIADMLQVQAGEAGRVYRHGGDEFVMVLAAEEEAASALGARLCAAARDLGHCTISVGVVTTTTVDRAAVAAADAALYEVKRRGRDGYHVTSANAGHSSVMPSRMGAAWTVPASLVDEIHEVVFTTDVAGRWTFLNRAWEQLVGTATAVSLGRPLQDWLHADDVPACRAAMDALLTDASATVRTRWRWVTAAGDTRWCEFWARPLSTPSGELIGAAGTVTDVTAQREADHLMRTQLGLSTTIAQVLERFASLDGDCANLDLAIDDALARLGRFAGVDRSYLFQFAIDMATVSNTNEWCAQGVARQIDDLQMIPIALVEDWMANLRAGRAVYIPRVRDLPDGNGLRATLEAQDICSLVLVPLAAGPRLIGFLGFDAVAREHVWTDAQIDLLRLVANALVSVITRYEATEQLARLALIDGLTGLPNRASVLACAQQVLDGADERSVSGVVFVDLDEFATVNDRFGHTIGDELLRRLSSRLSATLRVTDVLGRIGADQFAIICPELRQRGVALRIAERVAQAVRAPTVVDGVSYRVTASVGIAMHRDHGDATALVADAETAMRHARQQGRDRVYMLQQPQAEMRLGPVTRSLG